MRPSLYHFYGSALTVGREISWYDSVAEMIVGARGITGRHKNKLLRRIRNRLTNFYREAIDRCSSPVDIAAVINQAKEDVLLNDYCIQRIRHEAVLWIRRAGRGV